MNRHYENLSETEHQITEQWNSLDGYIEAQEIFPNLLKGNEEIVEADIHRVRARSRTARLLVDRS